MRGVSVLIAWIGLLSFSLQALAIQANLAGVVDWHKPLIGLPILEPTPPSLIETAAGKRILSITKSNVFAALNATDGEIVWRYKLESADPVVSYHVHGDDVLLLSGPSGSTARLFDLQSGQVRWERPLHDASDAHLIVPVHLGTDVGFSTEEQTVVLLSEGRRITKLELATGKMLWSLEAPGAGDTILFKQLLVTGDVIHTLALTSSTDRTTLTTLSFSLTTSRPLADFTQIPSIVNAPSEAVLARGSTNGTARVVWLEAGRIRSAYISDAGALGATRDVLPGNGQKYAEILDVGSRHRGLVLGKKRNGGVQIVDVNTGKRVDEFESSNDTEDKSASVYSAALGPDTVTFNRVYWSFAMGLAVAETNTVSRNGDAVSTGFTFPFDTALHGVILASAVNGNVGPGQLPHIVLTTSSGAVRFVSQEAVFWTREESLADLAGVKFVELGEREVEEVRHILAKETFTERLARHAKELKDLPVYLFKFAQRLTTSSYASTLHTARLDKTNLHRDQFGLQKLLVAVTRSGKVVAMDSSNGEILWSKNLGMTTEEGPELHVQGVWTVREVGEGVNPTLAVVATRIKGTAQTIGFHIDAFTGEIAKHGDREQVGKVLFEGKSEAVFVTPFTNCGSKNRILGVVDSAQKVHIFPFCKKVAKDLEDISDKFFFTLGTKTLGGSTISGHALSGRDGDALTTVPTWQIPFAESVIVAPSTFGPISSYGRALGDKSTLYKLLNPHLTVLTTPSRVIVVDTVTGQAVYEVSVKGADPARTVQAAMSENWLVYSWLDKDGWRLASVELYEDGKDSPGLSSFAAGNISVRSQVFMAPEIKALGMSESKFGVTAKDLIYTYGKNQVATIPRRLLDPRRPIGKPSAADKEEMLIPYDPVLPIDPKLVVSHKYQVLGAEHLVSSPALVESTSLLLAYGLDLFFTRGVNPSGTFDILSDGFNKLQLLLTLAVLSLGIAVAKPAVDRKALKSKWFG